MGTDSPSADPQGADPQGADPRGADPQGAGLARADPAPWAAVLGAGGDAGPGAGAAARRPWWRWWRWALSGLLVAVVVVELVTGRSALARAARAVTDPAWPWLVGGVALDVASMLAYAEMQRVLLRGAGVGAARWATTSMALAAHSMSITLPGGPVFSTTYNYRRMGALGAPRPVASWAIAVSATLSALALAVTGAAAGVLAGARGDVVDTAITAAVVLALAAGARALVRHPVWTAWLLRSAARTAGRVLHRDPAPAVGRLRSWGAELFAVRVGAVPWLVAAAMAVANWLLDAACLSMCCHAAHVGSLGAVPLLLAYTAGMAASSFPVVPGGLGVVDATLSVGLVAAGAPAGAAVGAVVLYRAVSLGLLGGSGWVLWWLDRRAGRR